MQDLPLRHMLDLMHCEKNVCENILKTIMGEKDTAAVRLDMQQMGIRPQLWPQEVAEKMTDFGCQTHRMCCQEQIKENSWTLYDP